MSPGDDIRRWSHELAQRAIGATLSQAIRRASDAVVFPPPLDDGAQALLVDAQGLVVAGWHVDAAGVDLGQDLAAQLSGVADEAARAARLLDLGEWRSMLVEISGTSVALAPAPDGAVVLLTVPSSAPLGMVRLMLGRTVAAARTWLEQRR